MRKGRFGSVLESSAAYAGPGGGVRGGKPPLELDLEPELTFENALHPERMRRIVDAARDRRILWSYTNEGVGETMELVGAGWSWLELARSS